LTKLEGEVSKFCPIEQYCKKSLDFEHFQKFDCAKLDAKALLAGAKLFL